MRFGRDQLVFKALCVLDDAVDEARKGQVPASLGLRFALAYLYHVSDGDLGFHRHPRDVLDEFWRTVRRPERPGATQEGYLRSSYARTCLTQICRQVRMPLTVELMIRLREARGKPAVPIEHDPTLGSEEPLEVEEIARRILADGIREERVAAEQRKQVQRTDYFAPVSRRLPPD